MWDKGRDFLRTYLLSDIGRNPELNIPRSLGLSLANLLPKIDSVWKMSFCQLLILKNPFKFSLNHILPVLSRVLDRLF